METPRPTNKRTWLIIWAAICFSIVQYGLVCFLVQQGRATLPLRNPDSFRPVAYILAVVSLVASVAWLNIRTANVRSHAERGNFVKPPLPEPQAFQNDTIIAMALAEACAVFGLTLFFMGASIKEFAGFAAGTLAILIAVILPRGLAYWAAWEEEQKPRSESPFSGISS